MCKKAMECTGEIDFGKQTPHMLIGAEKHAPLYERAFLSPENIDESEFAPNTTVWD